MFSSDPVQLSVVFQSEEEYSRAILVLVRSGFSSALKRDIPKEPCAAPLPDLVKGISVLASLRHSCGNEGPIRARVMGLYGISGKTRANGSACRAWHSQIFLLGFVPHSVFSVVASPKGIHLRCGPRFDGFCRHIGVDPATGDPLTPAPESPEPSVAAPSPK